MLPVFRWLYAVRIREWCSLDQYDISGAPLLELVKAVTSKSCMESDSITLRNGRNDRMGLYQELGEVAAELSVPATAATSNRPLSDDLRNWALSLEQPSKQQLHRFFDYLRRGTLSVAIPPNVPT